MSRNKDAAEVLYENGFEKPNCLLCKYFKTVEDFRYATCDHMIARNLKQISSTLRSDLFNNDHPLAPIISMYVQNDGESDSITIPSLIFEEDRTEPQYMKWPEKFMPETLLFCAFYEIKEEPQEAPKKKSRRKLR